jgi:hypothetical protein
MPVSDIKEIRLLPPLALGRLGSAAEAMHNYDLLPAATPAGYRRLAPAQTLVVDPVGGTVVSTVTPATISFRDGAGRIKPVAPFLELWARFTDNGDLEPLTLTALNDLGLTTAAIQWEVAVGNLKIFRRTGDPNDRITASVSSTVLATHARQELIASAGNFRTGRTISLGWVQYIRPTTAFPEIRFRFTPAAGLVFGHTASATIPAARAVYNPVAGGWDTFSDTVQPTNPTPRARLFTSPAGIYARTPPPVFANLGYLDDSCDGIVRASITFGGQTHRSIARISSGPPDFAPDSEPVRTLADDFEQMALGADTTSVTADEVIDIVRRAMETMRLMNTETQNSQFPFWVPGIQPIFGPAGARYSATRAIHEGLVRAVEGLHATATSPERAAAIAALERIVTMLREPDATLDYRTASPPGTRPPAQRMPAFMRGSDGNLLALTRRQQNVLRRAIDQFRPPPDGGSSPAEAMARLVQDFSIFATLHAAVTLPSGATLDTLFATPSQLLSYLADSTSVTRGPLSASLGISGRQLVVARDPANSALHQIITNPAHPMNFQFLNYTDSVTGENGVKVTENWINSL